MTRFAHSIWFFFAAGFALLASAVVMLFLSEGGDNPSFLSLVLPALLLSFVVPGLAALLSKRLIKWRQPLLAWIIFCLVAAVISLILLNPLLS